ncbi:hypothetical protein CPS_0311 [Colwellia psychrerythraea 34H]|uniref:Uncharacterized protein n=1 Tax=Colwellia psychrerythraea (strain 34H / ATCC BAA-681) TaxID=167879 RepID=Q48A36_COLP3|nr:hypothetical protein CPS_0311 [Colwellia psychrerythraea 34H]
MISDAEAEILDNTNAPAVNILENLFIIYCVLYLMCFY